MFLTKEILHSSLPWNILGYLLIAIVWGFGEGLYYIVLSQKINMLSNPDRTVNLGGLTCAVFATLIHGMIGTDVETLLEALATFILMYGAICVKDKFNNSWGIIAIFFLVWNAI